MLTILAVKGVGEVLESWSMEDMDRPGLPATIIYKNTSVLSIDNIKREDCVEINFREHSETQ